MNSKSPSLYEMLLGNFAGGLDLHNVSEENQVILSVLDNMQRILNCRAETLSPLPDYGLPDMSKILQGNARYGAFAPGCAVRNLAEIRAAHQKVARHLIAAIQPGTS